MKYILIAEYVGGFLLGIYLFAGLHFSWWLYALLFFTPDIGMLGYLINPRVGAATYNTFHHLGVAVTTYILGAFLGVGVLQLVGTVLIGHLFFDRVFGYGLKYADEFKHTHLGQLR